MKKGKFYHWKWKQEGNRDNRESANYKNMREQNEKLHSVQCRLAAAKRDNTYTRIMNLNERNDKQFFALVNRQRSVRSINTPILKIDDKTFNTPVTVLGAWTDYFEDLPTPSEQQSFDSTFLMLVNDDVDILTEIFTKDRQPMHEVTEEELSNCISNFKNGKAPDESKITIEHFKYGGNLPVIILTKLVNLIFQNAAIPNTLKSGIGCPIFKNGDKPNSYHRITVTSAIGKILEKLHLS
jgi:hypothetical protein